MLVAFLLFSVNKNKNFNNVRLQNNETNIIFRDISSNDSINLKELEKFHNKFKKLKESQFAKDSIDILFSEMLSRYKNAMPTDITSTFNLYQDVWQFYEDVGDHTNAIKCQEDFIRISSLHDNPNTEFLLQAYSVLVNQLLYNGQCEKAIETVYVSVFNIIDDGLKEANSVEEVMSLKSSKINMQTAYLLCARHMGDGNLQQEILKTSENLVMEKYDDFPNYNLYKADLLGMMASSYMRMGDLPKAAIFLDLYEKYMQPVDIIDEILLSFRKLYLYSLEKNETKFNKELKVFNLMYNRALTQFSSDTEEYLLAKGNKAGVLNLQGLLYESLNPKDLKIPKIYHSILDMINTFNYNAHINPLDAYDGLISFYSRKEQKDSVSYYLNKYKTTALELNSRHDIRNAQIYTINKYLLDKNYDKVDALLKTYLEEIKIVNLDEIVSHNDNIGDIFADVQTIRRLVKLATLFDTYSKFNYQYLNSKSNQLYILSAGLLNSLKINQGFNSNEVELLKEINEGILSTRDASLDNDDTIIRILEGNQSLELLQKNANKDIVIDQDINMKVLVGQRDKINRALNTLTKRYLLENNSYNISEKETYLELINSRDSISTKIKEKYPKFVFYTSPSFDLNIYRSSLSDDSAVVRFYVTTFHCYAYLITNKGVSYYKLGNRQELTKLINAFRKIIKRQEKIPDAIAAIDKYLKPILVDIKEFKNIKIITQEELSFLPFEVIVDDDFLSSHKSISYNSSLSLDSKIKMKVNGSRIAAFAPIYRNSKNNDSIIVASVTRSGSYELPNALSEATYVTNLYDGHLYSGEDANKKNFLAYSGDYPILHLAMHATVASPELNEDAMLLFSGSNSRDYLGIKDIYNLQLSSNLVTLSACSTAYGDIDPVEGVLSLSRAFQYAGSDATLTSLWRVPDKETSIIMKRFYDYLKEGLSKSEALKNAKQDYLKNIDDPNLKHPYYWAGFILTGDTSAIVSPTNYWLYGIVSFALILIVFLIAKRRLKPKS